MAQEERASVLALLAKSPEFAELKKVINGQIEVRRKKLEDPITSEKEIAEHNILIGEITGMNTVICWPDTVLKKLELTEEIKEEMEKANGRTE